MKATKRKRSKRRPRRPAGLRRASNAANTRTYRNRMKEIGIPDRTVVANALMREVLLEAWSAWQAIRDKDLSLDEHRIIGAAIKQLSKAEPGDSSPQYTVPGILYRLNCVLCEQLHLPRPTFDENAGKSKNAKPKSGRPSVAPHRIGPIGA